MDGSDSAPIDNWIIGPVTWAILYLSEVTQVAALLHQGVEAITGIPVLVSQLRCLWEKSTKAADARIRALLVALRLLQEQAENAKPLAEQVSARDYSAVNRMALVGMATAVDAAVEETVVETLTRVPDAAARLCERPTNEGGRKNLPSRKRARSRYRSEFRQILGESSRTVGECYAEIFRRLGINVKVSASDGKCLGELRDMRNRIVHPPTVDWVGPQQPLTDSTASRAFQLLEPEVGIKQYKLFYDVAGRFLLALLSGLASSAYCEWDENA